MSRPNSWYRQRAKALYHDPGKFEVDDFANVSRNRDGAYVQVWAWVQDIEDQSAPRSSFNTSVTRLANWFIQRVIRL